MQFIIPFDPSTQTTGSFNVALPNGGWMFLTNESPIGVKLIMGDGKQHLLPPNFYRAVRVNTRVQTVEWAQVYQLPASQAPISQIFAECYNADEWTLGEVMGPLPRQINLGNPTVSGASTSIVNDGNAVPTQVFETTPLGQGFSSINLNNDMSGFMQVLSANAAKKIINVVRGDTGGTKAIVTLGDSGDTSITTFYGTIGAGSVVPGSVMSNLYPKHITLDGTQADETFAGAGDLYIPHSVHVHDSLLGSGGVLVIGDNLLLDGGAITSDGAGKLAILKVETARVQKAAGVVNVGGTGATRSFKFSDSIAGQILMVPTDDGGGHAAGIKIVIQGLDSTNTANTGLIIQGNGVAQVGIDDAGTKRQIQEFEGLGDPSLRAGIVVGEGDRWYNG